MGVNGLINDFSNTLLNFIFEKIKTKKTKLRLKWKLYRKILRNGIQQ